MAEVVLWRPSAGDEITSTNTATDGAFTLRNQRSLIQTMGRAARNANGHVILYAAKTTASMRNAIDETERRRVVQEAYNEKHGIVPRTISPKRV